MDSATVIFVYGTLKRGQSNHRFLSGQHFLGTALTQPLYRLFLLEGYPGMVEGSPGRAIEGELWGVEPSCLEALDRLEGTAEGLYARVPAKLAGSLPVQAVQTYLYLRDVTGKPELGSRYP